MLYEISNRGPFISGPLSMWRIESAGSAIPAGVELPVGPVWYDDEPTPPPSVERDGQVATIHFHDVARFRIDFAERRITGFDIDPDTEDCVITHILHDHIAPRLLAELGDLVLHASTVRFGDGVALFLGETGAGKSTLATHLHQAGHRLLGDDAVIVTPGPDGYVAQVVYPSLRLFPEAIAHLFDTAAETSPMADYSDKQNVHLPEVDNADETPLPLLATFFLAGDCGATAVAMEPMDSTRACIKLVEQSFTLDARNPLCAARRLAAVSQMAQGVPAYSLTYPHDFARLGEVRAVIETTLDAHRPDPAARSQESLVQ